MAVLRCPRCGPFFAAEAPRGCPCCGAGVQSAGTSVKVDEQRTQVLDRQAQ